MCNILILSIHTDSQCIDNNQETLLPKITHVQNTDFQYIDKTRERHGQNADPQYIPNTQQTDAQDTDSQNIHTTQTTHAQ